MENDTFVAEDKVYALWWEGPFTLEELHSLSKNDEVLPKAWTIYSIYSDHPLYGKNSLTYVGKSRDVLGRLKRHRGDWWYGKVHVASVYEFTNWKNYHGQKHGDAIIIPEEDKYYKSEEGKVISRVEELLILGLSPAYNLKNKNTARDSSEYRLFNWGFVGDVPREVSSRFWIEDIPSKIEQE